jgi:hypothetical protein
MSKSRGVVTLTCKVPLLGKITGYKTMKEIVDGIAPADDKPAVAYKDLRGGAVVAAAADALPEKDQGDPVKPETATDATDATDVTGDTESGDRSKTETDTDQKDPSAEGASDGPTDEEKADQLLRLARNYIMSGHTRMGRKKLREVIAKYPDTKAAKRAKRMLDR